MANEELKYRRMQERVAKLAELVRSMSRSAEELLENCSQIMRDVAAITADDMDSALCSGDVSFDDFWQAYDIKVEKAKAEALWNRLSKRDRKAVMDYIPRYKQAQPDKRYRKHPTTFLRNRSWEDEIIDSRSSCNRNDTVMRHQEGGFDGMENFG